MNILRTCAYCLRFGRASKIGSTSLPSLPVSKLDCNDINNCRTMTQTKVQTCKLKVNYYTAHKILK
jgi:hypothetical protein